MSFTMASLLAHSEQIPISVRSALRSAHQGPPERQRQLRESAARILHREVGVDCRDARELVDLQPGDCTGWIPGITVR
jgi:hypothetical protein